MEMPIIFLDKTENETIIENERIPDKYGSNKSYVFSVIQPDGINYTSYGGKLPLSAFLWYAEDQKYKIEFIRLETDSGEIFMYKNVPL